MSKAPLYVAGTIFAIVSLVHLYRFFEPFNLIIGTTEVPPWANGIGFIIAAGLSYWMFSSACKGSGSSCCK